MLLLFAAAAPFAEPVFAAGSGKDAGKASVAVDLAIPNDPALAPDLRSLRDTARFGARPRYLPGAFSLPADTGLLLGGQYAGCTMIRSAADMRLLALQPEGHFVLTRDIDMAGVDWTPPVFSGVLDGAGHTIFDLSVTRWSEETRTVYDGNMKAYDTHFAGLFAVLDGGCVRDLTLENVWIDVASESECLFTGMVAGFCEGAVIEDCSVSGTARVVTASRCFGTGGLAGYGNGDLKNCSADVTLICIDTDVKFKDEQFMGGAYAAGFLNVDDCRIAIDGYDSDHGFVHDGGLIGMYIQYVKAKKGSLCRNRVDGRIRFFEDNRNRRAYCAPYVGEIMHWNFDMDGNSNDFLREELFVYDTDLLPEDYTGSQPLSPRSPYAPARWHCGWRDMIRAEVWPLQ